MKWIWMTLFIGSSALLLVLLLRRTQSMAILAYAVMNVVMGAVLLYLLNMAEGYTNLYIPINLVTVLTIGFLGVPGLLCLAAVKLALF